MAQDPQHLHTSRPAVYLDQWVWIRFAQAHHGRCGGQLESDVLSSVRDASAAGVAFPLSTTHYQETLQIRDPRQRYQLTEVMAPISAMRTLRSQSDLVRHQFLAALHESVGRPAFRPAPPNVLGHGASWAFRGVSARFRVFDSSGVVIPDTDRVWLRHVNQHAEALILAGPTDEAIPALKALGYLEPRELDARPGNRLAWEEFLVERLSNQSLSRDELSVLLKARELTHEYLDLFNKILAEYRLTLDDIVGSGPDTTRSRARAVEFANRVPTLRIAADMKLEMFRDRNRRWTWNMINDIDALSLAVPYCRVVVADRDAVAVLQRSGAADRHGTIVTSDLHALPGLLTDLQAEAQALGGDPTGWDEVGPGEGFRLDRPRALCEHNAASGSSVRLAEPDGSPTLR